MYIGTKVGPVSVGTSTRRRRKSPKGSGKAWFQLMAVAILVTVVVSLLLSACGGSASTTASAPKVVHSTAVHTPAAVKAVQAVSDPNADACSAFNTQSAAYQAPTSGAANGPAANQAAASKFLGQVSQDAYASTGTVHSALTSFASAFADYMSVTSQGEATSAEISALNSAGTAVNSACGH